MLVLPCSRASLAGKLGSAGLGSGAAGGAGASGKADPRPVTSKAFQSEAIAAIVDFCAASNYRAGPMNAKVLAGPTGKDFASIVGHLCQRIDASFTFAGRVEDEVQTVFKAMR